MSLTLTQMRERVRRGLGGLDSTDLPDAEADLLLNLSLWELDNKFPFTEKERRVLNTLVEGVRFYLLPECLDAIQGVSIRDDAGTRKRLARMTEDWFEEHSSEDPGRRGRPTHYLRRNEQLIIHPVPDSEWDGNGIEVFMWVSVASLTSGSVEETGLPRNWDEIVVQGAIVRGHYYNEDYDLAREAHNFQVGNIRSSVPTEAKEERDSRYARLDVLTDAPEDW